MGKRTVLLADDEEALRENLARVLRDEGFEVIACADGAEALGVLKSKAVDAIITDLRMPGVSGMDLIHHARRLAPDASIIVITAFAQVETAVEAMKLGAKDYICKPLNLDELILRLKRLVHHDDLERQNRVLRAQIRESRPAAELIGQSRAIREILETVQRVAQTMSNVLIQGESGTGKEVLARALHEAGITRDGPFVAVNCGGLVENLVESELFGHRKGAFTGAEADHVGYFEAAEGGTLFLDEVGNLPLVSQAVLLRAIEEKAVVRVGDNRARPVRLRIVAATNRDLEEAVEAGAFREDLFHRLNVVRLTIPPLRERPEDIPLLVDHFVRKYNAELKRNCPGFDEEAMEAMYAHRWSGNVRELENVVERALIFADEGFVRLPDLAASLGGPPPPQSDTWNLRAAAHEFERQHIIRVLLRCGNNRMATARKLGIGLSSLYRKMDLLGISKDLTGVSV